MTLKFLTFFKGSRQTLKNTKTCRKLRIRVSIRKWRILPSALKLYRLCLCSSCILLIRKVFSRFWWANKKSRKSPRRKRKRKKALKMTKFRFWPNSSKTLIWKFLRKSMKQHRSRFGRSQPVTSMFSTLYQALATRKFSNASTLNRHSNSTQSFTIKLKI